MLEILKVSDFMQPAPTRAESSVRCERLKKYREDILTPALNNSEKQSHSFSRAWVRIPHRVTAEAVANAWNSPDLVAPVSA